MIASKINKTTRRSISVIAAIVLAVFVFPHFAFAVTDPALTGGGALTGYSGSAMPVTNVQVTGTGNPTVPVKLRVASGTLAMSTTTGLTFTGSSTGSTLQFSGTLSNVNAALATLTYTRSGTGTDTLEASLVNAGEVFFPDNNHLYEYVSYTGTWTQAKAQAEGRTKYGATGYLTTITSQAENDFVAARLLNAGWMGAGDMTTEGDWKWVTGPESGTSFWSGNGSGSAVSGRYANWNTGEPNDSGSNEDCGQFLAGGTGKWNDLPCSGTTLPGYVVEYGGPSSPIDISSLNVSITTNTANNYPNAPSSLGPTAKVNGSWSQAQQPTLNFSLSDADVANTVKYRVQIDDSASFASPVVDYTSALQAQGSTSFTVGQAAGSGSYAVGSSGQTLADGSYYWRVRTTDNMGADSSYTSASSGLVAFKVDTAAPIAPTISFTSSNNDTTPSLGWSGASDAGAGLDASTPYKVYWSKNSNLSAPFTSDTITATTYTVPTIETLTDGTWYFAVEARDALGQTARSTIKHITIDVTAPTVPGKPAATTAANDNTPSWDWTGSNDSGVGLDSPAYLVEWSQSADFSGLIHADVSTGSSYTHQAILADGTWYFRVSAADKNGNESAYSTVGSITINTVVPQPAKTTTVKTTAPPTTTSNATTPSESAAETTAVSSTAVVPMVKVLVVDQYGNPVKGAKVTLHSTPRTAYSGSDGYAVFNDVEVGDHRVIVEYGGKTEQKPLAVNEAVHEVAANVMVQRVSSSVQSPAKGFNWIWVVIGVAGAWFIWFVAKKRRKHR